MPISEILDANALNRPDQVAVIAGDSRVTFGELGARVARLRAALLGVARPGDRVAILARNVPEYVEAFYAVPSAGMILTLLNYRLNPKEWGWILSDAGVRVLLVEDEFADAVRSTFDQAPSVGTVVVIGGDTGSYEAFLAQAPAPATVPAVDDEDVACLIYTSGTTGFPKGAMITHRNLWSAAFTNALESDVQPDDTFLMTFPMCHASGFQVFQYHLRGVPLVLMVTFDPGEFLRLVEHYRVTRTGLAPTMASFVLAHPALADRDVSSVRTLSYGGMPMPLPVARALATLFGGLNTGFGQSESTLLVTGLSVSDHARALAGDEHLLGSCGRAITPSVVTVLDEQMQECAPGVVGELCVRGPLVMKGYWGNPEGTAGAMAGGWLHTGDLARRDAEGFLYLVDRKKDLIISGGQNIYPSEIERVIGEVDGVAEVAVVGVPDEVWGERVVAVIAPVAGADLTEQAVVDACRDRLAGYKTPRSVQFWGVLPKTVTGKILKREVRDVLSRSTTDEPGQEIRSAGCGIDVDSL
jgi:acyl-CoA synthetase (AMP-forming)/AMP-acid ligase II